MVHSRGTFLHSTSRTDGAIACADDILSLYRSLHLISSGRAHFARDWMIC